MLLLAILMSWRAPRHRSALRSGPKTHAPERIIVIIETCIFLQLLRVASFHSTYV